MAVFLLGAFRFLPGSVLEDDRSKVQVCVRVKPLTAKEVRSGAKRCAVAHDNCVILGAKGTLVIRCSASMLA